MITEEQKAGIKRKLGHRYVEAIQSRLLKNKQFNRKGCIYSPSQITNVMNGVPHKIIEDVIWQLVEEQNQILQKRNELLLKPQ